MTRLCRSKVGKAAQGDRVTGKCPWGTRAPGLFEKPEGDHCVWSKVRRRVCERLDWRGGRA